MPLNIDTLTVRRTAYTPRELSRWASLNLGQLPFETVLSLEPLLDFYRAAAGEPGMAGMRLLAGQVEAAIRRAPELSGPLPDPAVLAQHPEVLDLLMTAIFPPALRDREIGAALLPFEFQSFYCTPPFAHYLTEAGGLVSGRVNLDLRTFTYGKILSAYLHLLRTVYGIDLPFDYPVVFTVTDPETGLDRHFDVTMDLRFVRVEPVGEIPPLGPERRRELFNNLSDLGYWKELFPPRCFRFHGFTILHADDVTEHRVLSLLENDLVDSVRILNGESFSLLAERLRALLRAPRIEVGLAAIEAGQLLVLNEPALRQPHARRSSATRYELGELKGSLVERSMQERLMLIVDDLAASDEGTAVEARMREAGVRNLVLAPLVAQDEPLGLLYLWSREPGTLQALNVMMLQEALPLFTSTVRRGIETLRNRVRNVILGGYTAIHPSVEWRFRRAVLDYLHRQEQGLPAEIEPIVFDDVFPLFATTDIRSSSTFRNEAVRHDLHAHLEVAGAVLQAAAEIQPLPVLAHLSARIERYQTGLRDGFTSGDEMAIRGFLKQDVEPILAQLRPVDPRLARRVDRYHACVDPARGVTYRRCRAFEHSVAQINRTISSYLDAEEAKMQAFLPHYFEKHQTDGVAFSLYAGASLVEDGAFDPAYVRILRLWQLLVMCGVARRVAPLKATLEVPLETTHLVLVQHSPVSIRFRFDESRFDVAGAQHIRYEIMKQRVEKATLKDSPERLTQPGRIAIVYSQDREGAEYARYVEYLLRKRLLVDPVEDLALADLQGMTGLRAFRAAVAPDTPPERSEVAPEALEQAIRALPAL